MAGFINTNYNDSIQSVLKTQLDIIKNPYYKWTDKNPTPATYFNINQSKSTLDEGSKLAYENIGSESPFKYNKINNMILYGIENPFSITLENDEFGLAAQSIEGEAIILPNTIIPGMDDQFIIDYIKEKLIFKVTHVESDTLEDGSNLYKIQFKSSTSTIKQLESQVVESFEFIASNSGTQFSPIIQSSIVDFIDKIYNEIKCLKKYYKSIFYNNRVQSFTFKFLESNFYDPYLIEFIINNKLMDDNDDYIYICHQTPLDALFPINYKNTFFYILESNNKNSIEKISTTSAAKLIEYPYSIFINRLEDYYEMDYKLPIIYPVTKAIPCFREELIYYIKINKLFDNEFSIYNIIIKYLNNDNIDENDINNLDKIDYLNNSILFYAVPCIIFCLQKIMVDIIPNKKINIDQKHINKI